MTSVEWQITLWLLVPLTPSQVGHMMLSKGNYGVFLERRPQVSASLKQCSFTPPELLTWTHEWSKSSLRWANNPGGLLDSWDIMKVKCTARSRPNLCPQTGRLEWRRGEVFSWKIKVWLTSLFSSPCKKQLFLSLLRRPVTRPGLTLSPAEVHRGFHLRIRSISVLILGRGHE